MSDHYNDRNRSFVSKSDTPEAEKDLWQTPHNLFVSLDYEFNFDLDVCANHLNSKCENHFSESLSALYNPWDHFGNTRAAFMNPPYSQTELFLNRAHDQAIEHNITVVALVNANTDTKWFANAVKSANEIRLITGRIGFDKVDGKKANGNTKGQCLIIWRGVNEMPCNIVMVDRDQVTAWLNK